MIDIIIIISAFNLIFSKFLDCFTTFKGIKNISEEKNRIARYLMNKFGKGVTIWGIFVFAVILSVCLMFDGIWSKSIFYKLGFIIPAFLITILQFSVAYTNHTKRATFITIFIADHFPKMERFNKNIKETEV